MDETLTLYVLLFPTVFNSVILLVLAVILYKMLLATGDLTKRLDVFLDHGQKELFETTKTVRQTTSIFNKILDNVNTIIERQMIISNYKQQHQQQQQQQSAADAKLSQFMSMIEIGMGIFNVIRNLLSKKRKASEVK